MYATSSGFSIQCKGDVSVYIDMDETMLDLLNGCVLKFSGTEVLNGQMTVVSDPDGTLADATQKIKDIIDELQTVKLMGI